jgi:Rrf2 family nitric oxide-sensitive transcriptional repressor
VECFDPATNTCVITPVCGLRHALSGAVEAFSRHLDQFSIADMIGDRAAMRARLQ